MIQFFSFLRPFSLCTICALLFLSCGMAGGSMFGSTESQVGGRDVPSWFLDNRPMDPHHIFAAATATAPKLQLASSKAASRARGDIAAIMEAKLEGLSKQFQEEIGSGPDAESVSQFTQTYKSVVSQTLNGSEVVEREIQREEGGFRAYVLMRMPIGQAQEELLARVQAGQNAFTRFRSSQAFEELEQEVEDYRQRQKERAARRRNASQTGGQAGSSKGQTQQTSQDQTQADSQQSSSSAGGENEETDAEGEKQETGANETGGAAEASNQNQTQGSDQGATQQNEEPVSEAQRIESSIRSAAEPWMGVPYQFGGESKNGVDCSGLTQALYEEAFSVDLPRTTGKQVNRGTPVERSEVRAGDLIFFRTADQQKHVGIYLDDGKFLHASSSQGVTTSPLRYNYWQQNYWTARRLPVI